MESAFFRSVPFSSATLLGVWAFSSFAGFLFLNALYLQQVRGFSAFHTGLCTLPLAVDDDGVLAAVRTAGWDGYGTRPSLLMSGAGSC